MKKLLIVGGGLAGCEAAWQAAKRGAEVTLFEMKPTNFSPAHHSPLLAELVCSNSLRSDSQENAHGLLKREMRALGSLMMKAAEESRVPAGEALAVDREKFAQAMTRSIEEEGAITVTREEVEEIPQEEAVVIATGPLTSDPLAKAIQRLTGKTSLYFYDAISPVVAAESIDFSMVFKASRYSEGIGEGDYLNCPLTREEYYALIDEIVRAQRVPLKGFEKALYFEGCLPIEVTAERGRETPAFGPLKPVGLIDPRTGAQPYAVVQLRTENKEGTMYGMVGFQTKLTYPEQKRVFRTIPGLEKAEFIRLGSVHRNTFINSPLLLSQSLELKQRPGIFFTGQLTGVEGYVESAAMGVIAGINAARRIMGKDSAIPPTTTQIGALLRYISSADPKTFQPMNANFGILPSQGLGGGWRKRRVKMVERALRDLKEWIDHTFGAQ